MKTLHFVHRESVEKGWSGERKYRVVDKADAVYLLRFCSAELFEKKQLEFENMKQVSALGVPMCQPLDFGVCDEGTYLLQGWIDGDDAEYIIPTLSAEEQYRYGSEAGRALKLIHSIPAPANLESWENRFNRKIDRNIKRYLDCPLRFDDHGGELLIDYLNTNRHLLNQRPQYWQHGDFHIGNMMLDRNGQLHIIDFNRSDFGDPWEEFNRIVWSAQAAPAFACGIVDAYFNDSVPMEFWQLLAVYIASNTLSSLPWAIPFGQQEIDTMRTQAKQILSWYDNIKYPVPTWYKP